MIRVLVVEDSETARGLLVWVLGSDPEVEVVGQARDGVEAIEQARRLRPDVITMDIQMPRLDGLAATREIMITAPTPIVIVTAGALPGEVAGSLDMLDHGALDVLRKPPGPDSPSFAREARRLVSTVKAMSGVKVVRRWRSPPSGPGGPIAGDPNACRAGASVVAIAASTGGPPALHRLMAALPRDFPAPVLIAQHITSGFADGLASWLDGAGGPRVKVAEAGEALAGATAYLAPDDRHLGASAAGRVELSNSGPIDGFRPSASHLFESAARAFGRASLGVILTGMGDDGVRGLRAIRQAGGRVIAQDEASSVVFGMPSAAIEAGVVDVVLPIDEMAERLAWMARPVD